MSKQRLIDLNPILELGKMTGFGTPKDLIELLKMQPVIEFLEIDDIGMTLKEEMAKRNMTEEDLIEYIKFEDECVKKGVTLKMILEWIENAQTIEAEPVRHGKWFMRSHFPWNCICGICGNETVRVTNYCPNCGAKMDGKVE